MQEPYSAANVVALTESDAVKRGDTAVTLGTGHGLKKAGEADPATTTVVMAEALQQLA